MSAKDHIGKDIGEGVIGWYRTQQIGQQFKADERRLKKRRSKRLARGRRVMPGKPKAPRCRMIKKFLRVLDDFFGACCGETPSLRFWRQVQL